jgi:hypothetical protein
MACSAACGESNTTKACPLAFRFFFATRSTMFPYWEKIVVRDCLRRGILIDSSRLRICRDMLVRFLEARGRLWGTSYINSRQGVSVVTDQAWGRRGVLRARRSTSRCCRSGWWIRSHGWGYLGGRSELKISRGMGVVRTCVHQPGKSCVLAFRRWSFGYYCQDPSYPLELFPCGSNLTSFTEPLWPTNRNFPELISNVTI